MVCIENKTLCIVLIVLQNQTCFFQSSRVSHFGELPDLFLPKIGQKHKSNSQDLGILWNPHLVAPKSATSVFLAFLSKTPKSGSRWFDATRCGSSQKSPNPDYLKDFFGVFEQFFGKTTSGSWPKQDIFNPWVMHVCSWYSPKKTKPSSFQD